MYPNYKPYHPNASIDYTYEDADGATFEEGNSCKLEVRIYANVTQYNRGGHYSEPSGGDVEDIAIELLDGDVFDESGTKVVQTVAKMPPDQKLALEKVVYNYVKDDESIADKLYDDFSKGSFDEGSVSDISKLIVDDPNAFR